jgi:hypothetical protein
MTINEGEEEKETLILEVHDEKERMKELHNPNEVSIEEPKEEELRLYEVKNEQRIYFYKKKENLDSKDIIKDDSLIRSAE